MQLCYVSSMFRSGSTMIARMLNVHPNIVCASDPIRPLFNSFRYDLADEHYRTEKNRFDPLGDYFLKDCNLLETILKSSLDQTCDIPTSEIIKIIAENSNMYSGLFSDALNPNISLSTYEEYCQYFLETIKSIYGKNKDISYVAFKEVWSIEFYPAMKRSFPSLKCIAIVRDPRAIVASKNATGEPYPYIFMGRQWRKIALLAEYFNHKYEDVLLLRYEDIVSDPETIIPKICSFLGVDYTDTLLDQSQYLDGRNRPWRQNTSYNDINTNHINSKSVERWRKELTKEEIFSIEIFTHDWMKRFGYEPSNSQEAIESVTVEQYRSHSVDEVASWIRPYTFDNNIDQLKNELLLEKMRIRLINDPTLSRDDKFRLHLKWW